jgi:hypothetical protein
MLDGITQVISRTYADASRRHLGMARAGDWACG